MCVKLHVWVESALRGYNITIIIMKKINVKNADLYVTYAYTYLILYVTRTMGINCHRVDCKSVLVDTVPLNNITYNLKQNKNDSIHLIYIQFFVN